MATRHDAVDKASRVNYSTALGRATEYGILADTYDQKNHTRLTGLFTPTIRNDEQVTDPTWQPTRRQDHYGLPVPYDQG